MTALVLLPGCSVIAPEAEAATSPSFTYLSASANGKTTRYWDCCKPSGSWPGKASVKTGPVKSCAKDGKTAIDPNQLSGCQAGGTSFMCESPQPWTVNEKLSYGFAAANLVGKPESDTSCACYALQFTSGPVSGKTFVAQVVNTASDLGSNQFALLIPGGGVGLFNGCQAQYNAPADGWGARYGGISSQAECSKLPAALQAGCNWRFGWFQNADNPTVTFRRVKCPAEITAKTGCVRKDE
ncbi:hypothetical protein JRI60_28695 [Archangium violaceum]|uniref:hypothetical protein n=1 Tax=Archangium violaceum TaxID=83451 RepID=UPI00194DBF99|nr:hypothetical protein [Archangium violaceum]QRN93181.1 hypothetical protein JRI60_28695 [Archangium violaceum]